MRCLLDTNICIYVIKRKPLPVLERFASAAAGDLAISSITFAELMHGVAKSSRPEQNAQALQAFCAELDILPFDDLAGESYGVLRARLEASGSPIGPMDMLIAAHALSLGLPLVTNNEREFARVPGLTVLNWA